MKKLLSILLSITMLISVSTHSFADDIDRPVQKPTIKVGINPEFVPFEYYEQGELKGFDIELMQSIGERVGYEIEFVDMPFDKLIPAVIDGEVVCSISAISVTEEREKFIDYTTPYLVDCADDGEFAIVFKNGLADAVYSGNVETPEEGLFRLFEVTIGNMIHDDTIYNLIEKYDLSNYTTATTYVTDNNIILYDDVNASSPSDWAKDLVSKAKEKHITESERNYIYTQTITREEFCELVFNLICAVNKGFHTEDVEVKFTDTDNYKVRALNQANIIYGKSETEFAPKDSLTREEAATILVRMINREMPMPATEMWFEFDDINDISVWASDAIQTMCNLGFMIGMGENKFGPKETYTVEQAIVTLMRVYEATRRTYTYETPLGIIQSEEDYKSHINFAVQCDAIIELIKDANNYDEPHYIINKPVKALTDQMYNVYISFDSFAEIFNGRWNLSDDLFEFTYDSLHEVELSSPEEFTYKGFDEWPNKTDALNVITFYPGMGEIVVNNQKLELLSRYGGKVGFGSITMYQDELYIPVQMVAELLNFDVAVLKVIF